MPQAPAVSPGKPKAGGIAAAASATRPDRTLVIAALCWTTGVVLGSWDIPAIWWLGLSCGLTAIVLAAGALKRPKAMRCWTLLALIAVGAAWACVRAQFNDGKDIGRFIGEESQLAQVTGVIEGPTFMTSPQRGTFGHFSYKDPATLLVLSVDSIKVGERDEPASGKLLVKVDEADHRLYTGLRIRATGWLSAIEGPVNPGEKDYRQVLADRGITGRLTLRHRGNRESLGVPLKAWLPAACAWLSEQSSQSLKLGMRENKVRTALLDTLLLGRRSPDLKEIDDAFRHVGLAHVLCISGLHIMILMGFVWFVASASVRKPRHSAMIVLGVLLFYVLMVPFQVPLMRAAIMAAAFCIGFAAGRKVRGVDVLAACGIILLVLRPQDFFNAGFQLSFVGVGALLLFATRTSHAMHPKREAFASENRFRRYLQRRAADYAAAALVAFALTMPLVAYHFAAISPWAVVLSILVLPSITAVLTLGFVKMLVGLALPTFGALLARPLEWATDSLTFLVNHASKWPGAYIELVTPPTAMWTVAALVFLIACFAGWFAGRRKAMAFAFVLCATWLAWPNVPARAWVALPFREAPTGPAMSVNMFSVGNGSCFLVRLNGGSQGSYNVMFDCGSGEYLDVGSRSIVPALRTLGVDRIDTLMISHADMDHFCGCVEVMDKISMGRVLVTPHLLAEARAMPASAEASLLDEIRKRGVPIVEVSQGWKETQSGGELELLWPPADLVAPRHNDTSLVLSVRSAGRRVLLNGDIQELALSWLLSAGAEKLKADVTDLPHHGSFVEASPRWLKAVGPSVVLQSTGITRVLHDKWSGRLDSPIQRLVTVRGGMAEVDVDTEGHIAWHLFRGGEGKVPSQ